MIVNLADPIKPTLHLFKFLPLGQVSSPMDERYQKKKVGMMSQSGLAAFI